MTLAVNLVMTEPSAKFISYFWRNLWCDWHVIHTPKCNESANIRANYLLWLTNTDSLCFPGASYELRHSLDLALFAEWPIFWQNAFGDPAYVNQTILKLRKKLGDQMGGQAKICGGMAHPGPPLESPLLAVHLCLLHCVVEHRSGFFCCWSLLRTNAMVYFKLRW